jgi:vanillate O-demethylase ferredoxin subunit
MKLLIHTTLAHGADVRELRLRHPAGDALPAWPAGARVDTADRPVRLQLAQSGLQLEVKPGTSLLDALMQADQFVAYDCKRGECGQCWAPVLAGEPLHRDVCLTPAQRAQGVCLCVGWSRSAELTLDL